MPTTPGGEAVEAVHEVDGVDADEDDEHRHRDGGDVVEGDDAVRQRDPVELHAR
jgi:hypothetical protein